MASWREQLRPASFRGVAFHVRGRERSGGRRLAEHVYPEKDAALHEDLGRLARAWSVEAYLIGADYMTARDRLIAALEARGPGEYVDRWGKVEAVVARGYSLSENVAEGGYATIRIDFAETTETPLHVVRDDLAAALSSKASGTLVAVEESFLSRPLAATQ